MTSPAPSPPPEGPATAAHPAGAAARVKAPDHPGGLALALAVIALWGGHLAFTLEHASPDLRQPLTYLHLVVQAWLSTGLFITAHDAMHGVVWPGHPRVNAWVGRAASALFAGFSYRRLVENHHRHHAHPATELDPDYHPSGRFLPWFGTFLWRYATWGQVLFMAVTFNVLKLRYGDAALWLFWLAPVILGTLQLFTVGTYLPHRPPHDGLGPHRSRTQRRNHLAALLACYFFGYHREHHEAPHVPWWLLYRT